MIGIRFLVNVFVLSLVLAIFEIWMEKDRGWGTGLGPFWGKKFFKKSFISKASEKYYFTLYHIVMFGLIVPLILLGEYLWIFRTSPLFYLASWVEIAVVEDFLWFVFNWYFPGSLRKLLAGGDLGGTVHLEGGGR